MRKAHSPRRTRRARKNETGMKVTLKNGPQRHRAAERDTERTKDQSSYLLIISLCLCVSVVFCLMPFSVRSVFSVVKNPLPRERLGQEARDVPCIHVLIGGLAKGVMAARQ